MKKQNNVMNAIENVIAVLLFVSMLLVCGKYIDIKINGKSSSLPEIPSKDMHILMHTYSNNNVEEKHTLLEPVSVAIKLKDTRLMAHTSEARESLLEFSRAYVIKCFSGESETLEFESIEEKEKYLSDICESENYILIGFYRDVPAAAFLPSLAREYESKDSRMYFNVQNLLVLADKNKNLYAIAVSSGKQVNILTPLEDTAFEPYDYDAYNDIAGFASFEYAGEGELLPVFSQSLENNKYATNDAFSLYGMKIESTWIQNTLDVFGFNKSFSKTFVTKDNSLVGFVDDTKELLFSNDGSVTYNSNGEGVKIYDILEYNPLGNTYTFPDKTLAVKHFLNMLDKNISGNQANLGITDVYYDEEERVVRFEMKYFISGICVTDRAFDAVVEMNEESITHVVFYAMSCVRIDEISALLPQKYAFFDDESNVAVCHYRTLVAVDGKSGEYEVAFATLTEKQGEER